MTISELYQQLTALIESGQGERTVWMGDPTTNEYQEVTGIWVPDDEPVIELECLEWEKKH